MSPSAIRNSRKGFALSDAWRQFWKYPSPLMLGSTFVVALTARIIVGDWRISDLVVPAVMIATFPFLEWMIHVCILHWRPLHVGRLTIDPLVARKHRAHHRDPRKIPLVFIPWQVTVWLIPAVVAIGVLAFSRLGLGLTYIVFAVAQGLVYEWIHHLIHTDYKPKTFVYRSIWRNHRLHHFKNERYWYTVTSSGTADRVLRTYPDLASVPTSPTAKNLLGGPHESAATR